jgi:hypothetical protein
LAALFINTTILLETFSSRDDSFSLTAVNTISPILIGLLPSTITLHSAFKPFLVVAVTIAKPVFKPITSLSSVIFTISSFDDVYFTSETASDGFRVYSSFVGSPL